MRRSDAREAKGVPVRGDERRSSGAMSLSRDSGRDRVALGGRRRYWEQAFKDARQSLKEEIEEEEEVLATGRVLSLKEKVDLDTKRKRSKIEKVGEHAVAHSSGLTNSDTPRNEHKADKQDGSKDGDVEAKKVYREEAGPSKRTASAGTHQEAQTSAVSAAETSSGSSATGGDAGRASHVADKEESTVPAPDATSPAAGAEETLNGGTAPEANGTTKQSEEDIPGAERVSEEGQTAPPSMESGVASPTSQPLSYPSVIAQQEEVYEEKLRDYLASVEVEYLPKSSLRLLNVFTENVLKLRQQSDNCLRKGIALTGEDIKPIIVSLRKWAMKMDDNSMKCLSHFLCVQMRMLIAKPSAQALNVVSTNLIKILQRISQFARPQRKAPEISNETMVDKLLSEYRSRKKKKLNVVRSAADRLDSLKNGVYLRSIQRSEDGFNGFEDKDSLKEAVHKYSEENYSQDEFFKGMGRELVTRFLTNNESKQSPQPERSEAQLAEEEVVTPSDMEVDMASPSEASVSATLNESVQGEAIRLNRRRQPLQAQKKEIRIGPDYQVEVGNWSRSCLMVMDDIPEPDELWSPFMRRAEQVSMTEQGSKLLTVYLGSFSNADLDEVISSLASNNDDLSRVFPLLKMKAAMLGQRWTDDHKRRFREAILKHDKNFRLIQRDVDPSFDMKEIVEYFYRQFKVSDEGKEWKKARKEKQNALNHFLSSS